MPTLEVRRHSIRKPLGGSQLSQDGVDLARRIGAGLGRFDVVACSVVPRARETAIAMGYAVDLEVVTLSTDDGVYAEAEASRWWEQPEPFAALAGVVSHGGAYQRYAHSVAALWRDLLTPLADDGRALFIGHSGELEAALIACRPHDDHAAWGRTFDSCEGARLTFTGDPPRFADVELLRLG